VTARWAPPAEAGRNRYADLLRVCTIAMVVAGHWLLTGITFKGGTLSGLDALDYIGWGRWVILVFQVMPVFVLLGGYVNARSRAAHAKQGEHWAQWVPARDIDWPVKYRR
jgi:surface polysaccharide O-acyltransferase-like enzyme